MSAHFVYFDYLNTCIIILRMMDIYSTYLRYGFARGSSFDMESATDPFVDVNKS